ncbi:hypothetical protein CDAR_60421 [Caerostris darwini]|uniref:Uncharacterized protein n=1 Tax=Caerostris darwini TaxID=1538125 RepID=A0AAV4QNY0_9ARAC|nr:hypothetical protein CDAR_60421 [Caerostris darwini]
MATCERGLFLSGADDVPESLAGRRERESATEVMNTVRPTSQGRCLKRREGLLFQRQFTRLSPNKLKWSPNVVTRKMTGFSTKLTVRI